MKRVSREAAAKIAISLAYSALGGGSALSVSGCAGALEFASTYTSSTSGIAGRAWGTPYSLDTSILPLVGYAQPLLFNSFDAAMSSTGTRVQLAATWVSPQTGVYSGWARLFDATNGWSSPGSAFRALASDGATSFGFPSIASGPSGTFLTTYFSAAAGRALSAGFSPSATGGTWTAAALNTTLPSYPDFPAAQARGAGPYLKSVTDRLGRGYVFFADSSGAGTLSLSIIESAATGISSSLQSASNGATLASRSGITAYDVGLNQICFTYETAGASLVARCLDTSVSSPLIADSPTTLSSDLVAGHESATDGAGGMMTVFYQRLGSNYQLYSSFRSASGSWGSAVQVDALGPANYPAPPPSGTGAIPGARPGVAYLGSGKYLAAWVGVDATLLSTQVLSSVYDPASGWSAPTGIPGTVEAFLTVPHAQSIAVFGNGDGNAGFALNHIHATEAIGGAAATLPTYLESDQVRDLQVARWQTKVGWLPMQTVGNLCYVSGAGATATNPQCTHRPVGLLLPSGRTLVFYSDRDDYTSGATSGNLRIAVVEFK